MLSGSFAAAAVAQYPVTSSAAGNGFFTHTSLRFIGKDTEAPSRETSREKERKRDEENEIYFPRQALSIPARFSHSLSLLKIRKCYWISTYSLVVNWWIWKPIAISRNVSWSRIVQSSRLRCYFSWIWPDPRCFGYFQTLTTTRDVIARCCWSCLYLAVHVPISKTSGMSIYRSVAASKIHKAIKSYPNIFRCRRTFVKYTAINEYLTMGML